MTGSIAGDNTILFDSLYRCHDQFDVGAHEGRVVVIGEQDALAAEGIVRTQGVTQAFVGHLPAQMYLRQRTSNPCHYAAGIEGKPVQLMREVEQEPMAAGDRRDPEQRLFPRRVSMAEPGDDPVWRALADIKLFNHGVSPGTICTALAAVPITATLLPSKRYS